MYLPTDGLLQSAFIGNDPFTFIGDGTHLSARGCEYVGKLYAEYVTPLIDEIIK